MKKIEPTGERFQKSLEKIGEIHILMREVKKDTSGLGSHYQMVNHKAYKELVKMGDKIVNYIFHLITHEGGDWLYFNLLRDITGQNPLTKECYGRFPHTMVAWLQWWLTSDYYKNDDIYHNLIDENET